MGTKYADQVIAALAHENWSARFKAIEKLKRTQPAETFAALVSLLSVPDQALRRRAGGSLARFRERTAEHADALASHLEQNPDPVTRVACGIALMEVRTPVVDAAYLHALSDDYEKVAMLACWQVADRCGVAGTKALFAAIVNRPWNIRMVACKALINQGNADERVVAVLEAMSREPEAAVYDHEQKQVLETLSEPAFADLAGNLELESVENTLAKARAVVNLKYVTGPVPN